MFYEAELRFLRDTFKKSRIQTNIVDLATSLDERHDLALYVFWRHHPSISRPIGQLLPGANPATVYRIADPFHCRYLYMRLPELPGDTILLVGPYLNAPLEQQQILETAERLGIAPSRQKQLADYYGSVPILQETSHLFLMVDTFAQRLWGVNGYTVEDISQQNSSPPPSTSQFPAVHDDTDAIWRMKNMELRYSYENELMSAVAAGQIHKADMLLTGFTTLSFEQRLSDPVRNAKNYCIIMNTLLRKAAEQGGVHPVYLDSTSSSYAARIEQLSTIEAIPSLMVEMFRGYCRLVRSHAMKHYSPPVQKVITLVDSDLTANLSLRTLAQALNVSGSYLSTLFKKETGKTLTEYINERRIHHAMHLLRTTRLQVQTVAQHCGIVDVQYFSKVFKKITDMTPKEYRMSLQR